MTGIIDDGRRLAAPRASLLHLAEEDGLGEVTRESLRARRSELLALAARRGALRVRIFGSVARREAGPSNDVDFVVEFEPGRSLLDHGGLVMDLEEALGCRVDVVSERGLGARMRVNVEREAVPL
jgi:uncharacterized protein